VIQVTFTPPVISNSTLPVYSGFIQIASGSETQRVSYLGAVGNLKDEIVLDTTDAYFGYGLPTIWNGTDEPQEKVTTYSLEGDDIPSVVYRCACFLYRVM
jgi:hypothetical protein